MFHEAIGVQIKGNNPQEFFIFNIPKVYTADWSPWVVPAAIESNPRREIYKVSYMSGRAPLEPDVLKLAPRLRYRLEYVVNYDRSSRLPERYEGTPPCS